MRPASGRTRIVVLNAGGTIACDEGGRFRTLAGMRSEQECRQLFEDLPARFRILFNDRRLAAPYQFTFRQIPGQGPQVSEDACPEYWNDILWGLQEIHDEHAQFLAGVIVLHGTDTMAYAAPLLYFRAVGVPYPVVLTGANHPPSEPVDTRLPDLGTDAWENIYTAAMFIATHGERFRGAFVAFAGRILLPVNVRKRKTISAAGDPLLELGARRMDTVTREILGTKHTFHFDNVNLPVPYLARLIDGEFQFTLPVVQAERLGARLSRAKVKKAVFAKFRHIGSDSWFHKVSPAEPFFFTDRYLRKPQKRQALEKELREEGVSVVVLGGYKSTTLPTEFGNGIRTFCELCKKLNITVLLTTRSGSGEPSQYSKTASLYLPQCKEMISETAVAAAFHVAEELRNRGEDRAAPETAVQEIRAYPETLAAVTRMNVYVATHGPGAGVDL